MLDVNIDLNSKVVLITGIAGFIGSSLAKRLLNDYPEIKIVGIDNMNDYYDVQLKKDRLSQVMSYGNRVIFIEDSIANKKLIDDVFREHEPDIVVNLAAQAGVRYSITNPDAYIESNIIGFYNILEACRAYRVKHLVYASSSSVYGSNDKVPYSETDKVDSPVSLYAATKKSNELLAHAYSNLYDIPCTGLRFFTVYGPFGRPDMAYFSFTDKLVKGENIRLFNYGNCKRDFTYIDDIIESIVSVMQYVPSEMYRVYNIGNSKPENLMTFVGILYKELVNAGVLNCESDLYSMIELFPMSQGDVYMTYADMSKLEEDYGFKPKTALKTGLSEFAKWYKEYYNIKY